MHATYHVNGHFQGKPGLGGHLDCPSPDILIPSIITGQTKTLGSIPPTYINCHPNGFWSKFLQARCTSCCSINIGKL